MTTVFSLLGAVAVGTGIWMVIESKVRSRRCSRRAGSWQKGRHQPVHVKVLPGQPRRGAA